ncbi:LysM peptidoglycan-binding domain-containing protein [Allohahella sp. A8]|uniref:LysM peptidoglycan-binding domain-containing protein n=1 Tax=Allohahella sp. A8 TaxID=3141461 RepID=UPI003A7FB8DC
MMRSVWRPGKQMFKRLLVSAMVAAPLLWQTVSAEPRLRDNHPEQYTVVKGDTLWGISSRFLQNPWYWPEIWYVNPQINDPHLIYPGDELSLVYVEGQPRVTVARRGEAGNTVKLSPKVRATPMASAIPAIPLETIQPFLSANRVTTEEELEAAPYVLLGKRGNLIVGSGDSVYARGKAEMDETYGIYRRGQVYIDPDTKEMLGIEARSIAAGRISEKQGDVATVNIQRSSEEIRQGDRLLQENARDITATYYPSNPEGDVNGTIVAVLDGVTQIGQYDVVVLNRGEREGIKNGNVLAVYKRGEQVRDPYTKEVIQLPPARAGMLMVFRVFDKMSYGLILSAEQPLSTLDKVRNPE